MKVRTCAALLLVTAPLHAAPSDPLNEARASIDACVKRLDARVDIGHERIASRCPTLTRTLERSDFARWLPADWKEARNNLSAGGLLELRNVLERETATRITGPVPRVETLMPIVRTLDVPRDASDGVWVRFKRWLRDVVVRRPQTTDDGWFGRLATRVGSSQAVVESVSFVALIALVGLAVWIVLNELKAAGVLSRGSRPPSQPTESGTQPVVRAPALTDVERAPLIQRPGLLLELLSAKLTALRRLPPASALTVRELTRSVQLPSEADRQRFVQLAQVCERARYAEDVPQNMLESAVEQGMQLLRSLDVPAASGRLAGERA